MRRRASTVVLGSSVLLCLCVLATTTPASAQLGPSPEADPRATRLGRPNRYLLGAGAAIFAAAYIPALTVAVTSDREGDQWLYAPIIGPWADLANREGCAQDGGNCDNTTLYGLLLVSSGIAQLTGMAALVASFVVPEYRTPTAAAQATKPGLQSVHISPMQLAKNAYGLGVGGRF